jgi:hypothetical protein
MPLSSTSELVYPEWANLIHKGFVAECGKLSSRSEVWLDFF